MNEIAMIAALCIISAILCKFFESSLREFKPLVSICAVTAGFIVISGMLSPICDFINNMMQTVGADSKYTDILFKSAAISVLAQLGSDVCRDAHEAALASIVEAAGRLSLAVISVTLLADIANIVLELTA